MALYASAESEDGASENVVSVAGELEDKGISFMAIALDGYVGRELMWAGVETTILRRGPGEAWRLRRVLRALGVRLLIVSRDRDERIAAFATFGLKMTVLRMKPDGLDHGTSKSGAKAFARRVGRELRPMRSV